MGGKVNAARFPRRLREARRKAGLTMETLADRVGLSSKQGYQSYESGRVVPRIDLCEKLASALSVRPEWLAGWEE